MAEDTVIRSEEQFKNIMAERRAKSDIGQVREEAVTTLEHSKVACQALKVVNATNMDPFVKRVMTLRIIGPMITGHERSHISIALELGATVDDVEQAEEYGIKVVSDMLEKISLPDFQEKYNRNRTVKDAVKSIIVTG